MDEHQSGQDELFTAPVGERLKAARIAARLELEDIAGRTRIPLRHLQAIERSDYAALPGFTYAIGFVRAYARTLDLDEAALAAQLRSEAGHSTSSQPVAYEPADPARVPPRTLAWTTAVIALLIVGGYLWWRAVTPMDPAPVPAPLATTGAPAAPADGSSAADQTAAPAAATRAAASGPVVLTANDTVWINVKDAAGKRLFEKEMQPGEQYVVPVDAVSPRLLTGRPQALTVTVGGSTVAPLGPADRTIRDVLLTPEALTAPRAVAPLPETPAP